MSKKAERKKKLPAGLVALVYDGHCQTNITREFVPGLSVDVKKGVWSWMHQDSPEGKIPKENKFDKIDSESVHRNHGVIGVYNVGASRASHVYALMDMLYAIREINDKGQVVLEGI